MEELIYSYSRKDAIEDGVLVDVSETAKEAGIIFSTAVTDTVWENYIEWSDEDTKRTKACQDIDGRLWDVLYMAYYSIKTANKNNSVLLYKLNVVPRYEKLSLPKEVTLKIVCGPGDDLKPVLTIMMPNED